MGMDTGANGWDRLADSSPWIAFIDACLRGASQVLLQNNPVTGLLILIGIAWAAVATGHPAVIIGVLVALVVGTVTAVLLRADTTALRTGLFGFNSLLTGAGVTVFMQNRPMMWLFLVLGAAATTVVMFALTTVLDTWGRPGPHLPVVLTTWFLLDGGLPVRELEAGPRSPARAAWCRPGGEGFAERRRVSGLRGGCVAGVLGGELGRRNLIILAGLAVNSWWSAASAAVGAVLGTLLAIWFGVSAGTAEAGLWGFNAVLTAVALGTVLYKPTVATAIYALSGVVFTIFIQAALSTVLAPLGIPTLTAPFVIATWLFILPKRDFAPRAQHKRYTDGLLTALKPVAAKPE